MKWLLNFFTPQPLKITATAGQPARIRGITRQKILCTHFA
jgi:hypothetical protein